MGKSKEARFDIKFMGVDAGIEAKNCLRAKVRRPV
jgi:hypothetical protein